MARDRKRAKRRASRPTRPATPPGNSRSEEEEDTLQAPPPLEHSSADVDWAEAQIALGRPEEPVEDDGEGEGEDVEEESLDFEDGHDELDDEEFDELEDEVDELEIQHEQASGQHVTRRRRRQVENGGGDGEALPARRAEHAPAKPKPEGSRVINFLRGSWRELQRVQWPDRRQVAQGTGVVLGFVIVSGAFLALMDFLSQKIVNAIL